MTKLLIISGTTATGKTDLAVQLAKNYNGELVSADSRQAYTGLDIISGKDIPEGVAPSFRREVDFRGTSYPLVTYDMHSIPIWLYDVVSPWVLCSISLYRALAMAAIGDITARGKLPIIVGGAGLYIDAIIHPPDTIDIPVDPTLRKHLDSLSVSALQAELASIHESRLHRMNNSDKQNPRRLIRAIEAAVWRKNNPAPNGENEAFDYCWVGLRQSMDVLIPRIAKRVSARWKNGALDEVKKLEALGNSNPAVTTLGIVSIREFLAGKLSESAAQQLWVQQEVAYAKRQALWFAGKPDIHWFDSGIDGFTREVENLVGEWYTSLRHYADKSRNLA